MYAVEYQNLGKLKILETMFCHPVGQKDVFLVLKHAGM